MEGTYYLVQKVPSSHIYPDDVTTKKPAIEGLKCQASSRREAVNRFQAVANEMRK